MRAVRPRRLAQVVPFAAEAEPADLIDSFSRLSAWSFMVIVCAFSVTRICGALAQFTSVMVPIIEYTLEDSANSGGAGAGAVFGAGGAVVAVDGFASGSVLSLMLRPESEFCPAGALPADSLAHREAMDSNLVWAPSAQT